ncbi:F-BAR domain only protein 2 isoform X1 [Drosophila albomicans]|uniref:F-BAR domain only protein 2 n=1 Tax=Drosophila albomicans TaxID=7291 RepID=A0A6P8XUP1_DROAB|nr:F-BAR domain only protein 2 isoform X1 [Drosophila albomicans]
MTVDFNDYFWGEKNNGFDVLYHNMKFGLVASKELSEFLREKSNIEEQNSKMMSKLAHKASTGTLNSTFAPVWTILRTSAEKLSTLHMQMVQKLTELVKDVAKYADELHKKHKCVKDEESQTLECVQAIQTSTVAVQKLRDLYASKVQELEKLRKDNGSHKDAEKLESKLKKLQEEYKALLDKHNPIKNEFERRMTQTCKRFQEIEEVHLRQMKEFLSTYLEMLQNNHDMVGQVHSDFKRQFVDMSVDKLLEQFVLNKYTGLEKPEMLELEFVTLSGGSRLQPQQASAAASNSNSATSIQAALRAGGAAAAASGSLVSMDQRGGGGSGAGGDALAGISLGSGSAASGSIPYADDAMLGSGGALSSPRPTSPETLGAQPAAASGTTSTVKSLRSWFMPTANKQQLQQQSTSTANFGMPGNSNSANNNNYNNTNIITTTATSVNSNTNNTTTGTINFTTNVTNKNSPNSEHQDNQDQQQQQQQHEPHEVLTPTANVDGRKQMNATTSEQQLSKSLNEQDHLNHQQQQQQTAVGNNGATTTTTTTATTSRRTTSLLNIFTSNSQVSGILRSRRDKAKTKKSKKKKDNEAADNKQEERLTSAERANNTLLDYDDHGRSMKTQNSSGSSAGGGLAALSATSAQGSVDSAGVSSMGGSVGGAIGTGATGNGLANTSNTSGAGAASSSTTGTANAANASGGGYEVDEEGFSIQPAKEIAWEEGHDKSAGSFYSDSDTDSENDKRRIHVKIKPLNNGQAPISASVDELRATVENISLSPTGVFAHHSQQLQGGTRGAVVSRQQSPEISNASTPTASVHPYAPLQSPTLSNNNANNASHNRYADLGDIFSELGEMSASAPPSATLSKPPGRQIPTPTSAGGSSIVIPRPPSRRSDMIAIGTAATAAAGSATVGRGRMSPAPAMNRADSIGSLEFRTAIGGMGSSRGPSPLTIGISDTIPLAVAFHEIIHAYFRGSDESRCQVKVSGDMMLSFPAGIAGLLANNPNPAKLGFRIKQVQNLDNLVPNGKLVQIDRQQSSAMSTLLEFNMPALTALLRRQAENNPNASYFNVDILKYQVRTKPGASSCPFQLVSYWKCEPSYTALKVDYKYNNHAMASASPLLNVTLSVPVNGSVRNVQSKPHSSWLGESNRLVWNFTDISQNSQDGGVGTLRARLELNDGPSTPAMLATQFNCEGTTLSGIEFELQGSGYRLSLVKRRFVSGKYVCEGDGIRSGATPTPPSVGSTSPYSAKSN